MNEGWIKLHRQILDDPLYFAEPFTRMQAFIDLILIANIKQTTFFKRGIKITVERGQTARSEDELAERWKWSRGKARRFLIEQQNDGKIVQQKSHVCSCISVVNYDKYQIDDTTDSTTNDTTDSTTDSTTKNKKEKNNILSTSTTRTHVRDGTTEDGDPEDDIDKDIEQLKASVIWIEQICMKHKILPDQLPEIFDAFAAECRCNGLKRHQDLNDAQRHFNNWLRIYKQNSNGNNSKSSHQRTSPADNIEAAQRAEIERTARIIAASKK
jgi:hypothetical protein